ncbi:unnamed protein product [Rotaria socialis]|uniref:Kinesin-like protein KIF2A-like N-terminal domain-containing protein n=2 Tax=Rotaria socialis TaxID=392032 RepID=A0A818X253_9BILA|nr:unnamed protein product [Rotaria socialis]
MRIHFDINANNVLRATFYACAIFVLVLSQLEYTYILDRSQESVFLLMMPNVTSVETNLYYGIPYEDCRCSIVATQYCLTYTQLKISRILPLVLFVLQLYLIRELILLSGDHVYFLVNMSWIVTFCVFIAKVVQLSSESKFVGVEWNEHGEVEGKEILLDLVFGLNNELRLNATFQQPASVINQQTRPIAAVPILANCLSSSRLTLDILIH